MKNSVYYVTAIAISMLASASQAQQIVVPNNDRAMTLSIGNTSPARGTIGGLTTPEDDSVVFAEVEVTLPNGTTIVLKGRTCTTNGNEVTCTDK